MKNSLKCIVGREGAMKYFTRGDLKVNFFVGVSKLLINWCVDSFGGLFLQRVLEPNIELPS